eukprot:6201351-Pleurochrysis_carterae.AAC.1
MAGAESAEVSAAAAAERPAASASAAVTRPWPPSSVSSARTNPAAGIASAPYGRSSSNSAAEDDCTLAPPPSPAPSSLNRDSRSAAGPGSSNESRRPLPSLARALAPLRASASAAFSATRSLRIIAERGESSTNARAGCCVARRGDRHSGERSNVARARRCGDAAPPPPSSAAAADLSARSANAPRAPAVATTPTSARRHAPPSRPPSHPPRPAHRALAAVPAGTPRPRRRPTRFLVPPAWHPGARRPPSPPRAPLRPPPGSPQLPRQTERRLALAGARHPAMAAGRWCRAVPPETTPSPRPRPAIAAPVVVVRLARRPAVLSRRGLRGERLGHAVQGRQHDAQGLQRSGQRQDMRATARHPQLHRLHEWHIVVRRQRRREAADPECRCQPSGATAGAQHCRQHCIAIAD